MCIEYFHFEYFKYIFLIMHFYLGFNVVLLLGIEFYIIVPVLKGPEFFLHHFMSQVVPVLMLMLQ